MRPIYFPSREHQLFGWLHLPAGATSDWGVVVCKPFGYEALCAHRSLRAFADSASALGMPALRFDYAGTGDSADIDPNADQAELWTRDVASAVAELRRLTGVSRVCLLGFRLGALLSVIASRQCPVEALALIAPVLSGKRYSREFRTLQMAAEAAEAANSGAAGPRESAGIGAGGLEVSGYALAAASLASLSQADAAGALAPTVADLLVIDRSDLPVARAWGQAARDAGARVEYQSLPGFVEMMLRAPQFAKPPQEMLQATSAWLLQLRDRVSAGAPVAGTQPPATELVLEGEGDDPEGFITESGVFLGADQAMFGILTSPRRDENRRRAVVLLNIGADYHIGASRMYVSLARRWARRGYYILRMDLAGLGDSNTRPGRTDNEVFPPEALEDIRTAIDFLVTRHGIREVSLLGLCAGAYHGLRAAIAGLPLVRVLMVNPSNYFWDQTMSLEGLQLTEVVGNPGIYRERIVSLRAWRRLLSGQVNIWRIVKIYMRLPVLTLQSKLRDAARAAGIRLRHDLGRELEAVIARGVRMVFIFARGEPGLDLLKIEAGSMIGRLGERCRLRIIDSADHTFSRSGAREVLENVLSDELYARQEFATASQTAEGGLRPA
ncbi:MAG TPA: alpha/beta hydrolase [Steroidobacteraceae bacterium]